MQESDVIAGKYRLLSLLGRGGMGSVWRAQHLGLDAPVAIKLMDAALASTPEGRTRFHREAQSAAALRSPHVVQVLDHGFDESTQQPFIVMELMEGVSLASRLEHLGRLSPRDTARVITHVARALARAHASSIVHRDLKPDNVFLVQNEDEEIAKVLDFGIAKFQAHRLGQGAATQTGAVMGTAYYMSPEQISGSRSVDGRTDLWALGVIACECLTGRRPFEAETIGGLALKICVEAPLRPSDLGPVPPAFDAWFERATARDMNLRFQSARELADALRLVCEAPEAMNVASPARSETAPPHFVPTQTALSRSTGRHRSLVRNEGELEFPAKRSSPRVLAGVLLMATVAVVLGVWLQQAPRSQENLTAASAVNLPARAIPAPAAEELARPAEPVVEPVPRAAAAALAAKPAESAIQPAAAPRPVRSRPGRPSAAPSQDPSRAKAVAASPPSISGASARPSETSDVLDERR